MITATTVNDETFEGENFCGVYGFSINHESFPTNFNTQKLFCCYVAKLHKFSLHHE